MTTFCRNIDVASSRRQFLQRFAGGLAGTAFAELLTRDGLTLRAADAAGSQSKTTSNPTTQSNPTSSGILDKPHYPPRANRIIWLFMAGGPSQLETFDYKPLLNKEHGKELPDDVRKGQRLTGMSGNQASLPLAGSAYKFAQHGQSGAWVSEILPWTAKIADELCFVKSMHTEHINHDPAITFCQTGHHLAGRPSMGSWLSYGLGSSNENLPSFVVLVSKDRIDQPLYSRLWGNGFLPSKHQGVQFRSGAEPVLYLKNPEGIDAGGRRAMLDLLAEMHTLRQAETGDAELGSRIAQYEMAYRMQTSVPDVLDLAVETAETLDLYGPEVKNPGSFAANCLLARRLAERDVRFIQLYHPGWDQHGGLPGKIKSQCRDVDQPAYALINDLKRRGMLDDTLVVWGGEFGRTNYSQGKLTATNYGRDHHPRCFTMWMAGAGIKSGITYGKTDDYGYNIAENPVTLHDLQATLLERLGIDHERLTYRHQGRDYRLTDVEGRVLKEIL